MKIKPLYDKLLIKHIVNESKTASGLYIPEQHQDTIWGIIVASGKGRYLDNGKLLPNKLKVGDKVCWCYLHGTKLELEDGDHTIIKEEHVFCKVN